MAIGILVEADDCTFINPKIVAENAMVVRGKRTKVINADVSTFNPNENESKGSKKGRLFEYLRNSTSLLTLGEKGLSMAQKSKDIGLW